MNKKLQFALLIAILLFVGLGVYLIYKVSRLLFNTNAAAPVTCDMMAKLCPDGSAVGRTGPNCEFAPCP
ncbi:MAG: hypothetical protein WCV83_04075 [Candidatus Magasanikbacteria bacterium]|jgi:hypothetical protein